jgi:predicted phage-related endonuclease
MPTNVPLAPSLEDISSQFDKQLADLTTQIDNANLKVTKALHGGPSPEKFAKAYAAGATDKDKAEVAKKHRESMQAHEMTLKDLERELAELKEQKKAVARQKKAFRRQMGDDDDDSID